MSNMEEVQKKITALEEKIAVLEAEMKIVGISIKEKIAIRNQIAAAEQRLAGLEGEARRERLEQQTSAATAPAPASMSGTDAAAIVEQLTKMVEQQAIIGNQLQHLVDLVEPKTVQKEGSLASARDFNKFFSFSRCSAETWMLNPANTVTEFRSSAKKLILAHQSAMRIEFDAKLVNEKLHVQADSKELLEQLMDSYFPEEQVELRVEWPYSCRVTNRDLESIKYSGRTDAVIKIIDCDIVLLCWEIKNQTIKLDKSEIAQTAAEVSGALDLLINQHDIKPRKYAAVLTNGLAFIFIMAAVVNGVYTWRHSPLVTNADAAAAMMEGCFSIAAEVFQLYRESLSIPIERLQLNDTDANTSDHNDDHDGDHREGGGADDDAKSGSKDTSLGGIRRDLGAVPEGSSGMKSAGEDKATKKRNIENSKSDNCQDYRFAPLTIPNVELFNRMRGIVFSCKFF